MGIIINYWSEKKGGPTKAEKEEQRQLWVDLLNQLCKGAKLTADDLTDGPSAVISMTPNFCSPMPSGAGCKCLCKLLESKDHNVELIMAPADSMAPAETTPDDIDGISLPGMGSDATVTLKILHGGTGYYLRKKNGDVSKDKIPDYVLLGHELCSHVARMFEGTHPARANDGGVLDPNLAAALAGDVDDDEALAIENAIRDENGLPRREKDDTVVPKEH